MGSKRKINAGIYKIINIKNNKIYIGGTQYLDKRKSEHFRAIKNKNHYNRFIQEDLSNFNHDDFVFEVLENIIDIKTVLNREQYYIDKLKPEYNICPVAGNSLNVKRTEEFKEKIRKLNTGLKHPQWRNELKSKSQGGENHWTKNKSFSEKAKLAMSLAQKRLHANGYIHPTAKKVSKLDMQGNFIKEYKSLRQAYEDGFTPAYVIDCCNNKRESYKNFKFKWEE